MGEEEVHWGMTLRSASAPAATKMALDDLTFDFKATPLFITLVDRNSPGSEYATADDGCNTSKRARHF